MVVTQAKYFTKNNNSDWGNCNAIIGDSVGSEVVASFSGTEIGKRYNVNVLIKPPTGSSFYLVSPYMTVGSIETLITGKIASLQTGTYKIISVSYNQGP